MRPANPFLRSFVRAELMGPWAIDPCLLEGTAEDTHRRAVLLYPFAGSELLAAGCGYAAIPMEGVGCGLAGAIEGALLIRQTADIQQWNLRVLHELAHMLLRAMYPQHTHADCWALTLMLACPRSAYRHIEHADHVPRWALDLRRETAQRVGRCA